MAPYGYIIMIIVDSCMIWFHFGCIMQLKISYHFATNVCSRKSATTFGDLPDWKCNDEKNLYQKWQLDISETKTRKFLVVYIDDSLNSKKHISYTAGKISRGIGVILKSRKYLNEDSLLTL